MKYEDWLDRSGGSDETPSALASPTTLTHPITRSPDHPILLTPP
jgi:hypothetical protein